MPKCRNQIFITLELVKWIKFDDLIFEGLGQIFEPFL